MKTYQAIASALQALRTCEKKRTENPQHWGNMVDFHQARIDAIVKRYFPSGSGFDCGTKFDADKSNPEKLVFTTEFHHTSEHGYYDGWTQHTITVRASLAHGFDFRVSGKNRNEIKDFISDTFAHVFNMDVQA